MEYRYIMNGESLTLDADACTGCGICREVCPHGVFEIIPAVEAASSRGAPDAPDAGGAAGKRAVILERSRCMECGACAINCPRDAITVNKGVGCAAAVIAGMLKKAGLEGYSSCSCSIDGTDAGVQSSAGACCGEKARGKKNRGVKCC